MSTSTKFTVRWDRIIGATVVGLLFAAMLVWWMSLATEPAHGDAPRCTDAIADAGGVCWGEPLPECPTEDSDNCYWDGGRNGLGRSFYNEHGQTVWLDDEGINE